MGATQRRESHIRSLLVKMKLIGRKWGEVNNFQKVTKCGVELPIAKFANLNAWRIP
jgi:hypothetical protein